MEEAFNARKRRLSNETMTLKAQRRKNCRTVSKRTAAGQNSDSSAQRASQTEKARVQSQARKRTTGAGGAPPLNVPSRFPATFLEPLYTRTGST